MERDMSRAIRTTGLALLGMAALASARPFIVGADVSWLLEDESVGATYWDGGTQKDLFQILKDHGVNFIRVRTFVNSCAPGGYASNSYSGASTKVCWCDLEHTIALARRIKAARMGFLLDFHMSDTWASIGEQHVPAAWSGMTDAQMQKAAYEYVRSNMQTLIQKGLRPDMVQVGNEVNSAMSGVSISKPGFVPLVNAGIKAVRELDPGIKVVMQHGRPRPDGGFMDWYGKIKGKIDYDFVGGSTYGTTNNGGDWREMFGNVVKDGTPVLSLEYSGDRLSLINTVMNEMPGQKGLGTFVWEPTRYGKPMFDRSGNKYTANAKLDELQAIARLYSATLPDFVKLDTRIPDGVAERRDANRPLAAFDPANGVVTVDAPRARLRLLSTRGDVVVDVELASGTGAQSFVLPSAKVGRGVYLLDVRAGDESIRKPIAILAGGTRR